MKLRKWELLSLIALLSFMQSGTAGGETLQINLGGLTPRAHGNGNVNSFQGAPLVVPGLSVRVGGGPIAAPTGVIPALGSAVRTAPSVPQLPQLPAVVPNIPRLHNLPVLRTSPAVRNFDLPGQGTRQLPLALPVVSGASGKRGAGQIPNQLLLPGQALVAPTVLLPAPMIFRANSTSFVPGASPNVGAFSQRSISLERGQNLAYINAAAGAVYERRGNRIQLESGQLLVSSRRGAGDVLISSDGLPSVLVGKNAESLVTVSGKTLRVINLSGGLSSVRVALSEHKRFSTVAVHPGYELVASSAGVLMEHLTPQDGLMRRDSVLVDNGKWGINEVSLPALIKQNKLLHQTVLRPSTREARTAGEALLKTAAAVSSVRGDYGFTTSSPDSFSIAAAAPGVPLSESPSRVVEADSGQGPTLNRATDAVTDAAAKMPESVKDEVEARRKQTAERVAETVGNATTTANTVLIRVLGMFNGSGPPGPGGPPVVPPVIPPVVPPVVPPTTPPVMVIPTLMQSAATAPTVASVSTALPATSTNGALATPAIMPVIQLTPAPPVVPTDQNSSMLFRYNREVVPRRLSEEPRAPFAPRGAQQSVLEGPAAEEPLERPDAVPVITEVPNSLSARTDLETPADTKGRVAGHVMPREIHHWPIIDGLVNSPTGQAISAAIKERPDVVLFLFSLVLILLVTTTIAAFTAVQRSIKLANTNIELQKARDAAFTAAKLKTEFVANISHEIRTPVSAVLGMINILRETELNEKQSDVVGVLNESARSLLDVITDMLDFSKIEAGMLALSAVDFKVADLVHEVTALLSPGAKAKGLDLTVAIDPQLPVNVHGDKQRIKQVLLNLAGNAVKFTAVGQVAISVSRVAMDGDSSLMRFSVEDSGIGIDQESTPRLFEPFVQADGSTTRKFGGTGLGLSISKRLVELMGGEIGYDSVVGQGTNFWFVVPCLPASSVQPESAADQVLAMPLHSVRVLVAEDSPVLQRIVKHQLESLGFEVITANNGLEAVELMKEQSFALVMMDWQMPEMDGITATKRLREMPGLPASVPIIAMTAHAMEGDKNSCLEAGMNDYVSKPFTPDQLKMVLERWIKP